MSQGTPEQQIARALGAAKAAPVNDPAFASKHDRLADADRSAAARIVSRDIPLTTVNTTWSIGMVREAMQSLVIGLFDTPAQLVESIVGDSRVQAAMLQRNGALLSEPIRFSLPKKYKDDPTAQKCLRSWEKIWPLVAGEAVLSELLQWSTHLGFGMAQINWDTTTSGIWRPYLQVWNPRYSYYHWLYRCYVAIGLDGQQPVFGGNGQWLLHTPHGEYRGWIRGAMRAIAPWWLARNYALRDWARYSERNGMPWIKGKTPAAGDLSYINQFLQSLSLLGQETAIVMPQGVDAQYSYDVELLESAVGDASAGYESFINRCSDEITLAIMGQNLTTQVTGGSMAASKTHKQGDNQQVQADGRALALTLTTQVCRPFALFNFGDARFAPVATWDTAPPDDQEAKGRSFAAFTKGLSDLKAAGYELENAEAVAKELGLKVRLKSAPTPAPAAASPTGHAEPDGDEPKDGAEPKPNAMGEAPAKPEPPK